MTAFISSKNTAFSFSNEKSAVGRSRLGTIRTPHGTVPTPNFVFCATKATIKCVPSYQIATIGADIILSNTYHLLLRPGAEHLRRRGGLHRFMNWNKPLLTDSGGYQIFAMGHGSVSEEIKKTAPRAYNKTLISITEDGALFRSYVDGKRIFLSPEQSIHAQTMLGADLIVQFDECTPFHATKQYTETSMHRSVRWGARSLHALSRLHDASRHAMYGVIQGGVYEDLRKESIARVEEQSFFATAIGGCLGEHKNQMHDIVAHACSHLRQTSRPVHLLGIGDIADIFHGVEQGIDTFDCVRPTRIARHACAIVPHDVCSDGTLNLKNARYAHDDLPVDPLCPLPCCRRHSRAYLHHLFRSKELLGSYLLSVHNIGQMVRLMRDIRTALRGTASRFAQTKAFWIGS